METPRSKQFDDIYFAVENGLAESKYVFLEHNNLPEGWAGRSRFTICETGFGTGLNFLCAWSLFEETARPDQQLTYISFEKYPLSKDEILEYLAHWSAEFGGRLQKLAELYPLRVGGWHKIRVSERVTLLLIFDDVNRAIPQLKTSVDCWFLDGHAPAKNPDMWSEIVFSNMARLSSNGARLATFTAAGSVRRGLEGAGFKISKEKGYGVKRDMTVGEFEGQKCENVSSLSPSKVAVVGAGIAGTALAYALSLRGISVDLYEKRGVAKGGSGNLRGLFNPRFTAQQGPESDFYSSAFALAIRVFEKISKNHDIGYLRCGSLHLVTDETREKRFVGFLQNWGWHEDHARLVGEEASRSLSHVPTKYGALYLPDAGMVGPFETVSTLAGFGNLIGEEVCDIQKQPDGKWVLNGRLYDAVALACAGGVTRFSQASFLPVSNVRGQVSIIQSPEILADLQCNLCYGGYTSHPFDGKMVVGSTFQAWIEDLSLRDEDHVEVLGKLSGVVEGFDPNVPIVDARAGFRCAAKDRVPVIGRIPDQEGLYVSVAHGSHGLITSLMGAEMIASQMTGEIMPVPQNVVSYLSAQRFLDRAARRAG